MNDMSVPRKLRVWAERITTEPPFAERGIPDASAFYALLDARLPALPPRHRAVLARAKHAVIEHIDTAREAFERMRAIESEQLPVSAEFFPAEGSEHSPIIEEDGISWVSGRRSEGIIDTGYLEGQFARAVRMFAHEARAALESLVYELSFALDVVPKTRAGVDDETRIGISNQQTKDAFARRIAVTQSGALKALNDHLTEVQDEAFYEELEALRRVAYHRTVPYVVMQLFLDGVSATEMPQVSPLTFYRPADFEDPAPDAETGERYTTFCALTLAAVARSVNTAYALARQAMMELDAMS